MVSFLNVILSLVVAGCAAGVLAQGSDPADFTGAQWIWSGRPDINGTYPVGNVTFRRDYSPPSGRVPISANITITADNAYTLYVNGLQIGDGGNFAQSEGYCVRLDPNHNVFAVVAQNQELAPNLATTPNPAGFLATMGIRFSDGLTDTIGTDEEWHAVVGNPTGFEQVAFDDSGWPAAVSQGPWPNTGLWMNSPQAPVINQDISCASINLNSRNGKSKVGAIVGGVVGSVGGLLIIACLAAWLRHRKHNPLSELERQHHSVYNPFYPDLIDRSLANNAALPGAEPFTIAPSKSGKTHHFYPSSSNNGAGVTFSPPSAAAGTSSSGSGPGQDLRSEVEQLRREMEVLRTERIQESEPPPLYDFGGSNNADGREYTGAAGVDQDSMGASGPPVPSFTKEAS